ncbi:hypothetical protein [Streptomyces sp. N35]|uniref:hypothetical protein n=1 Tax=Streptomyces sp. N35 TaxID=2795730 RepID=UPI0018F62C19|nr:hypothetical protein [Streptomyces sp. N35]
MNHGVVFLNETAQLRAAIVQDLATADDRICPGLEHALHLVDDYATTPECAKVRRWVAGILDEADVDPGKDLVQAVKSLRQAVPDLGPGGGRLADQTAHHPGGAMKTTEIRKRTGPTAKSATLHLLLGVVVFGMGLMGGTRRAGGGGPPRAPPPRCRPAPSVEGPRPSCRRRRDPPRSGPSLYRINTVLAGFSAGAQTVFMYGLDL